MLLRGTPKLILADCLAISSSLTFCFSFCSLLHRHQWTIASPQQKRTKTAMRGERTVRAAQTTHSTHPQMRVLQVVSVLTDLLPYWSMVVVVISYSGISVYWLRQESARLTCFCILFHHIFQNPLRYLAMTRKMMVRPMQMMLMMAVAQKNSQPFTCFTPNTMKRIIPPQYPIILHITPQGEVINYLISSSISTETE